MTEQKIIPDKVTKPIQLLAAWLVGLIVVNASFLLGAQQIDKPEWASSLLVIASVVNVPVFIFALFLLQTKFRPQMQEDSFYAQYLQQERQFTSMVRPSTTDVVEKEVVQTTEKIVRSLGAAGKGKEEPIAKILRQSQHEVLIQKYGRTRTLSELHVSPKTWEVLVDVYGKNHAFVRDMEGLLEDGLVEKKYRGYRNVRLTSLGKLVAKEAEGRKMLFSQSRAINWERMRRDLLEEII